MDPSLARADFGEETFLTTDTSFVDNPPSSRVPTKFATPAPASRPGSGLNKRGGGEVAGRGRGVPVRGSGRGGRGSGIARGKHRGGR